MGVTTTKTIKRTFTCDNCDKTEDMVREEDSRNPGSIFPGLTDFISPEGWSHIRVTGLPPPDVERIRRMFDGDSDDLRPIPGTVTTPDNVAALLNDWDGNENMDATPRAENGDKGVTRVLCPSCLVDVWNAIGLPKPVDTPLPLLAGGKGASRRPFAKAAF